MSKKLKRSAVALVLAATMVFSSQGVLTAFAAGENETSTAVDVSALEPILDKEETVVVEGPSNTDETETPEVTEPCGITEGCTLPNGHPGECQVAPVDPPVEDENGEDETQPCTKTEGCTLENGHEGECVTEPVTPPEEENGEDETQPCEKTEGCTLPNGHEGECVVEENTEDTEDTQEPSEEDVAAVQAVVDLINALPTTDDLANYTPTIELKPEDEGYQEAYQAALDAYYSQVQEQVKATRAAYDALTEEQKAAFDATVLAKLTALEELIAMREQADVLPETEEIAPDTVAIIETEEGLQQYKTLDEAVAAFDATQHKSIELCKDDTLSKLPDKDLSFTGKGNISLNKFTINPYTHTLSLQGNGISFTWTDGDGGWLMLSLSGTINVKDGATFTMSFDSNNGSKCAIYPSSSAAITVDNGSTFQILGHNTKGITGEAIQLDPSAIGMPITITNNSTFLIDGTNRGYTGSPTILVENSTFTIKNCTNNASNGGDFTAINSTITYQNNAGHGLSADNVVIKNSTFTSDHNGHYGLKSEDKFFIDSTSTVTVTRNSYNEDFAGLKLRSGVTDGLVEAGATVNITGNYCSGLSNNGVCEFEEGVNLTITGNNNDKGTTSNGGGIYNSGASANLALPSNAVIYNNHADTAGDDIFNNTTSTITFGKVGSDWVLDDCNHTITGWFDDSANSRWNVHTGPVHAELYDFDDATTTVSSALALKAAHPYQYDPDAPTEPSEPVDWETSKSKTATNLDENYESQVTLSLPAKDIELVSDVVFVLDESSAYPAVAEEIDTMLEELVDYIKQNDITIKVGFVVFRGNAVVRDLEVLSADNLDEIDAFITDRPETGGSNMMAGLEAAQEMLAGDTTVDDSRKYMILISDGITYTWSDENGTQMGVNFANADRPNIPMLASPDGWDVKYGNGYVPSNWEQHLANVGSLMNNTIEEKASPYVRDVDISKDPFIANSERYQYVSSVDIALYKCNELYQELASKYHCYTVMRSAPSDKNPEETEGDTYPYGPSFMNYISDGVVPDFSVIEKEIIYLLDAGSSVIDVIGGDDNGEQYDYDFDFVNDLSKITLTVNGVEKEGVPLGENHYGFGEKINYEGQEVYEYELTYYPNGLGVATMAFENEDVVAGELFVWDIYVPVKQFEPVQLTYTVKLANPKTADGTYGQYDEDGSKNYAGLYTNNSAVLFPVDSNGNVGEKEAFDKPTVSYTVSNGKPVEPTPDPDPDPDRPSRPNRDDDDDWEPLPDAPVKDKPTTEVDVPEETETPTTEQPDKYNPETGDTTTVFAAMALAAVSLGGVVLLGRKKK